MTRLGDAQFLDELVDGAFHVRTYPAGRTCAHDGCGTVLSVYNPTTYCGAHEPEPDWCYDRWKFALCRICGSLIEIKRHRVAGEFCRACIPEARRRERRQAEYKTCGGCGEVKHVHAFGVDNTKPDGRRNLCKPCRQERLKGRT